MGFQSPLHPPQMSWSLHLHQLIAMAVWWGRNASDQLRGRTRAKLSSAWNELPARNGRRLSSGPTQVGPAGQRGRDTQGAQSWMEHLTTPVCKENGEAHGCPSRGRWPGGRSEAREGKAWTLRAERIWGRSRWSSCRRKGFVPQVRSTDWRSQRESRLSHQTPQSWPHGLWMEQDWR